MKSFHFLFLVLALIAGAAPASAQTRTPINRVPFTITKPGNYYLAKDLVLTQASTNLFPGPVVASGAITIASENVDLDLNGRTLTAAGNVGHNLAGVFSEGTRGVTVRNGIIRQFICGVRLTSATDNGALRCEGISVSNFPGGNSVGIQFKSHNGVVRSCSVVDANVGLDLQGIHVTVQELDISMVNGEESQIAIKAAGTGFVIERCRFRSYSPTTPRGSGIFILHGPSHLVSGCYFLGYADAIKLGTTTNTDVKYRDNTFTNCTNVAGTNAGGNQ